VDDFRVVQCIVDNGFSIHCRREGEDFTLRFESEFVYESPKRVIKALPRIKSTLGDLLELVEKEVYSLFAHKNSELVVNFSDDIRLTASHDRFGYESWSISCSDGLNLASLADSELAIWTTQTTQD
jgi:hypothetical protein